MLNPKINLRMTSSLQRIVLQINIEDVNCEPKLIQRSITDHLQDQLERIT